MLEAFDVSILFPVGYAPVFELEHTKDESHDPLTTQLLDRALNISTKDYFQTQWSVLQSIRQSALAKLTKLEITRSRYRIGLLHVYLFYRVAQRMLGERSPQLKDFIKSLIDSSSQQQIHLNKLSKTDAFRAVEPKHIYRTFETLSRIFVRKGRNAKTFCDLTSFSNPIANAQISKVRFNPDLKLCLEDLKKHIGEEGFVDAIQRSFCRFDETFGLDEVLEDLADLDLVIKKERFVREHFFHALADEVMLAAQLQKHAKQLSFERSNICTHQSNWVLEMLLYTISLNSAEDIQKRFKANFESSGHKVRPHAPYGGHAQTVAFLIQGRDICEQWASNNKNRTLTEESFRSLSWDTIAKCIIQGIQDKKIPLQTSENVIQKYQENKAMRVISSDLNGFYIMVEHYLSDLCFLQFTDDLKNHKEELKKRLCASWQTDVINKLWGARPLETWVEGVSKDGKWLVKVQSAQDGNEGHKTKELAGRCRAMRLVWSYGDDPRNRSQWTFSERPLPKLALVLDGDWDASKKRNLYEAGWDWVGDVSQLHELRQLIQEI